MKKMILLVIGVLVYANAQASCSNGTLPAAGQLDGIGTAAQCGGSAGVTNSRLTADGLGLWITGCDSSWGTTQVTIDPSYKPPLETLLACVDAARKAQMNPNLKFVVSGTGNLISNIWGSNTCGMSITADLSCGLQGHN